MRKKLNLLFGLVLIISMIILTGCGGSGKTEEKNPYEGKWVAVSAQMMGMSVSIDETFGGAFEFEVKKQRKSFLFSWRHYREWEMVCRR